MRSITALQVTASVLENGSFKNRKEKNENAKDCADRNARDESALACNHERMDGLKTAPEEELQHCRKVLKVDPNHRTQWHQVALAKVERGRGKNK